MFALGLGCVLGQFVNFGGAVACAYFGWSPWWLLLLSFVANLFAQPLSIRNDMLERALHEGGFPRTVFYLFIAPALVWFVVQLGIYLLTRWMLGT